MKQTKLSVASSSGRTTIEYVLDESELSEAELVQDFEERKVGSAAHTYWSTSLVTNRDPQSCPITVKRRLYSEIQDYIEQQVANQTVPEQSGYFYDSTVVDKLTLLRDPRSILLTANQVHDSTLRALEFIRSQASSSAGPSLQPHSSLMPVGASGVVSPGSSLRLQQYAQANYPMGSEISIKSKRIIKKRNLKAAQEQIELLKGKKLIELSLKEGLSQVALSKRLGVSLHKVKSLLNPKNKRISSASQFPVGRIRFAKITKQARQGLLKFIKESSKLLQSKDMQQFLKNEHSIQVSRTYLQQFLREEIGMSYQRVGIVTPNQNSLECKAQRQRAAQEYIRLTCMGKTIINIDESVLSYTEHRKRGWSFVRQRTRQVFRQRLPSHNIIAGVSNKGDAYFTINRGKTNSSTFLLFITKLAHHLKQKNENWKESTIFLLDNAAYHRSKVTREFIRTQNLPVMYLGPYNFHMAPVEKFFAFVKNRPLNPDQQRTSGLQETFNVCQQLFREFSVLYIQKLAHLIKCLEYSWLPQSFAKSLIQAVNCLCLEDI